MTDNSLAPAPPPAPTPPLPHAPRAGWAWLVVGLLAAAGALLGWTAQQRLRELESELVKRQQDSQGQAQEARLLARQAQELARESAARVALLESRLAEVALQRGQVEDLVQSLNRSRDETLVDDLEGMLRAAVQQAALTGSADALVAALQGADERLARARQPRLEPVRRAVARDLDRVKAAGVADLGVLTARLDEAVRLIDDAPLLSEPSRAAKGARQDRQGRRPGERPAGSAPHQAPEPAAAPPAATAPWTDHLVHWGQWASRIVWEEARALIRLTRIEQPEAMLIAPDQAFFLRENLKLRLLNARLNLLSRQGVMAATDVQSVRESVQRYYDAQSRKTRLLSQLLDQLASQSTQTRLPGPENTLAALATLAGGR